MKLEQANARAKTTNKVALEAEKEKDAAEKTVEELKRQLQPKRAHTDDDGGDADDLLAEVDSWCQACSRVHLDRRPVHSHIISRDSESREKGSRYCCEGAEKGQTWRVGVHTGSRSVVN